MPHIPGRPTQIWRDIPNFEGLYQVSCDGNVRSLDRCVMDKRHKMRHIKGRVLRTETCKSNGYVYVNLHKCGKLKHCTVHRLVALTFIPNPDNLPCVNHKDENRENNSVENLEWITNLDNLSYSDAWVRGANNRRSYSGQGNPFYGKHHTDETRKLIAERGRRRFNENE